VHAAKALTRDDLRARDGAIEMSFTIKETSGYSFHVHSNGASCLAVEDDWLLTARGFDLLDASASGDDHTYGGFLLRNLPAFAALVANGATVTDQGASARVNLASIDFQVLTEVLLHREYDFTAPRAACVIDVGMNVGVASLSFARQACVTEVHAFEPFRVTYERGLKNFALNPELAAKIHPHNIGLGSEDADHVVLYNEEGTIGGSVLGLAKGSETTIRIRDAAAQFRPIVEKARADGAMLIVKLDCEGSEFAIFESLAAGNLLDAPDAYLIEWHKWWNGRSTQAALVEPLLARGFVVFDQSLDSSSMRCARNRTRRRLVPHHHAGSARCEGSLDGSLDELSGGHVAADG
jgi:FkbM family methyltransferase